MNNSAHPPKNFQTEQLYAFREQSIGVIGDLMLDQFVYGEVERISPEAPIPVVKSVSKMNVPGGAGNTAANISALGGKVAILGVIGNDLGSKDLVRVLNEHAVDVQHVLATSHRPTTTKIRIVAQGQQIVRVDEECVQPILKSEEDILLQKIQDLVPSWACVVISDYDKGVVTPRVAQAIIACAREYRKPVIVDTKPRKISEFSGASLITPNLHEALQMANVQDLKLAGRKLQEELQCDVLITQGAEGMTLFHGEHIHHFDSRAKEVYDVSGAGDTVIATLALALAVRFPLDRSADLANCAASIVVSKRGTATLNLEELIQNYEIHEPEVLA